MKEVNDKKESMKPMSRAAVELDDEALDQSAEARRGWTAVGNQK